MCKFKKGDRVKRRINHLGPVKEYIFGNVTEVQNRHPMYDTRKLVFKHFYTVRWEDGSLTSHHLSCGLTKVVE